MESLCAHLGQITGGTFKGRAVGPSVTHPPWAPPRTPACGREAPHQRPSQTGLCVWFTQDPTFQPPCPHLSPSRVLLEGSPHSPAGSAGICDPWSFLCKQKVCLGAVPPSGQLLSSWKRSLKKEAGIGGPAVPLTHCPRTELPAETCVLSSPIRPLSPDSVLLR